METTLQFCNDIGVVGIISRIAGTGGVVIYEIKKSMGAHGKVIDYFPGFQGFSGPGNNHTSGYYWYSS